MMFLIFGELYVTGNIGVIVVRQELPYRIKFFFGVAAYIVREYHPIRLIVDLHTPYLL
jgi:hypothetical protein